MSPRCRFTFRSLFVALTTLAVVLAWGTHNYRVVQQRKAYWPQFNDHDFSVRAASVFKIEAAGLIPFPPREIPWIRRLFGDSPTSHLIYNPSGDLYGSQLRRSRVLFPEAKIWGSQHIESLPQGVERLSDHHYVRI